MVCIFEDIDAIVQEHGEDELLALLDGEARIDYVLNVATTNYPGPGIEPGELARGGVHGRPG